LCASIAFFVTNVALADEWHHSISVPTSFIYDSNLSMSSTDKADVTRGIITPTYNFTGTFGVDEFKAGLHLNVERSSDQRVSADRETPDIQLGWRHQTETGELGLTSKYIEESSQLSQLQETGLRVSDSTRTTWSLGGNWSAAISERSTLSANAAYVNVSHDAGSLTNYENYSTGVNWSYAWSETIQPFLQLSASYYRPELDTVASSDFYTVQGGVKVKLDEQWDWSIQAGQGRIVSETSDNDWLASATVHYAGTRSDLSLNTGRSVSTSGEGGFVRSDNIKGAWSYAYSELSRVGLTTSWQENQGVQPNTMYEVGAWIGYDISPFWNARLTYLRKLREQDGQDDATANVATVMLVYTHPDF
jgi:hypothetical protein